MINCQTINSNQIKVTLAFYVTFNNLNSNEVIRHHEYDYLNYPINRGAQ